MPLSNYNLNSSANNNNNNNTNTTTTTTTNNNSSSSPKATNLKINNCLKEVEVVGAVEAVTRDHNNCVLVENTNGSGGGGGIVFNGNGTIVHRHPDKGAPLPYEHLLVVTPGEQVVEGGGGDNGGGGGGGDQ